MKIIALSDIHNRPISGKTLEDDLRSADLVVVAGDLTTFCGYERAEFLISQIRALNNAVFAVAGNCDTAEVERAMVDYGISVDQCCKQHCGLKIIGVNGVEGSSFRDIFYHKLKSAYAGVNEGESFMVVSHQPLSGSSLSDRGGFDGGSSGIRRFILKYKPLLAVCGHIHDALGSDIVGSTHVVNPGPYAQGFYAAIELDENLQKVKNVDFKQSG